MAITSPAADTLVNKSPLTVSGIAKSDLIRTVELNGTAVTLTSGVFSTSVTLREGVNTLRLVAYDADRRVVGSSSVKVTLDSTPPKVTIAQPQQGQTIRDSTVTVQGSVDDPTILYVKINGEPMHVLSQQFSMQVVLSPGSNRIVVEATDAAGNKGSAQVDVKSEPAGAVGKVVVEALPQTFELAQNFPNPFNPETTIRYQLPAAARVRLEIYDLLGQRVRTLVDELQPAGFYGAVWDGQDEGGRVVSSGVYFYRLTGGEQQLVRKMLLVR